MKLGTLDKLTIAAILINLAGSYALDRVGLLECLLSPNGALLFVLLPITLVFYLARFWALFVAPGWVLGTLALRLFRARGRAQFWQAFSAAERLTARPRSRGGWRGG
jgi:hypothetical protein